MQPRAAKSFSLALVGLGLLAGCGFELRGLNAPTTAALLSPLYIESAAPEAFTDDLLAAYQNAGGVRARDSDGAAELRITSGEFTRDLRTTDDKGRESGFTYRYQIAFALTAADGRAIETDGVLTQVRAHDYDPEEELQAQEEAEFLRAQMRRELVMLLLQRLRAR